MDSPCNFRDLFIQDPTLTQIACTANELKEFFDENEFRKYVDWIIFRSELVGKYLGIDQTTEDGSADLGTVTRHEFSKWIPFMLNFVKNDFKTPKKQFEKACLYKICFAEDEKTMMPDIIKDYEELRTFYRKEVMDGPTGENIEST